MCGLEAYKENQAGSVYVELKMRMPSESFDSVTKLIFWIKNNLSYIGDYIKGRQNSQTRVYLGARIIYFHISCSVHSQKYISLWTEYLWAIYHIGGILHCSTILIQADESRIIYNKMKYTINMWLVRDSKSRSKGPLLSKINKILIPLQPKHNPEFLLSFTWKNGDVWKTGRNDLV